MKIKNITRFEKKVDLPGDSDGAWVLLRAVSGGKLMEIECEHRSEEKDGHGITAKILACMVDWGNVLGDEGEKLPLLENNKRAVLYSSSENYITLAAAAVEVINEDKKQQEQAEKNL